MGPRQQSSPDLRGGDTVRGGAKADLRPDLRGGTSRAKSWDWATARSRKKDEGPSPGGGASAGRGFLRGRPACLPTCVLLDSGEGRMEGLSHGRALSCGQTEGLSGARAT